MHILQSYIQFDFLFRDNIICPYSKMKETGNEEDFFKLSSQSSNNSNLQQHLYRTPSGGPRNKSRRWTKEQDNRLLYYVQKYGESWSYIGELMKDKKGKSCRERWVNNLNPRINWNPMSLYEQWLLYLGQQSLGPQWSAISKLFGDRTDNQVKNHSKTRSMKEKHNFFENCICQIIKNNGLQQIVKNTESKRQINWRSNFQSESQSSQLESFNEKSS